MNYLRMCNLKEACRLCLYNIKNNFVLIDDTLIDILNTLSIKLEIHESSNDMMCNICSKKLLAAFEFKSTCKYTENAIFPYADLYKLTPLDLRNVYLQERDDKDIVTLSDNEKVCRFCMELTRNEFVSLEKIDTLTLHRFLPEFNTSIINHPVVCKSCFDSFVTHTQFIRNCLDIQERIKNMGHHEKLNPTVESLLEGSVKMEQLDIKCEDKFSVEPYIKLERIKTEIEENELRSAKIEETEIKILDDHSREISPTSDIHPKTVTNLKATTCNKNWKSPRKPSKLKIRQSMQKDPSQVQTFKCDICDYTTHIKFVLIRHQLIHKDPYEVQMFECDVCNFKTKQKSNLARHIMLTHQPASETKMYTCNSCDYKTRNRGTLEHHRLTHVDASQLPMYKCDLCDYVAKRKRYLRKHELMHKDPSQVQMHKCDLCDFQTKFKYGLKKHQLIHKPRSQVTMHKCGVCDYATIYTSQLKMHELMHKDPSQVQMHKCDVCDYETKYKPILKRHLLIHKDRSQVQMHKCETCNYESKFKGDLRRHRLRHKDPRVQMKT